MTGLIEQFWEPASKRGPWGHDYNGLERDAEMYAFYHDGIWGFAGGPDGP